MDIGEFKNKIVLASNDDDYYETTMLCIKWLRIEMEDFGKEGDVCNSLLDIVEKTFIGV